MKKKPDNDQGLVYYTVEHIFYPPKGVPVLFGQPGITAPNH